MSGMRLLFLYLPKSYSCLMYLLLLLFLLFLSLFLLTDFSPGLQVKFSCFLVCLVIFDGVSHTVNFF